MMGFKKGLVCSIKSNGKILREIDNVVQLPFKSEYSILLKNLENRDALINVEIDGMSVFSDLVIHSNETVELERYQDRPNKFKFIEKTQQISDFRGDRIDDGFVRISFRFVKEVVPSYISWTGTWDQNNIPKYNPRIWMDGNFVSSYNANAIIRTYCCSTQGTAESLTLNDGITVPGNISEQKFFHTSIVGALEDISYAIVIHLKGIGINQQKIERAVTVKDKIKCPTCGTKNKSNHKFCSNCGTALFNI